MLNSEKNDRSMVGEDLTVKGDISCKSDLIVEGRVDGDIACDSLIVSKTGLITGDISAAEVRIEGTVHGMIKSESIELKDGCTMEGDIASHTLAIDHGADFTGSVKPSKSGMSAAAKPALLEKSAVKEPVKAEAEAEVEVEADMLEYAD